MLDSHLLSLHQRQPHHQVHMPVTHRMHRQQLQQVYQIHTDNNHNQVLHHRRLQLQLMVALPQVQLAHPQK